MTTRTPDPAQPESPGETPPESPKGSPRVVTKAPGWATPTSHSSPSPAPATDGGSDAGADSPGPSDEPPASRSPKSGGSRTSSPVDETGNVEKAIQAAVIGGTELAHELLVHDPDAKAVELLLADDEDADGIAEPGARLLVRRLTSGINNPDLADGIELAIAVGMYVTKQLRRLRELRRIKRAQGATLEDLAESAGEPA